MPYVLRAPRRAKLSRVVVVGVMAIILLVIEGSAIGRYQGEPGTQEILDNSVFPKPRYAATTPRQIAVRFMSLPGVYLYGYISYRLLSWCVVALLGVVAGYGYVIAQDEKRVGRALGSHGLPRAAAVPRLDGGGSPRAALPHPEDGQA